MTVQWWHVLIGSSLRYGIFAGLAYLLFYVWKRRDWFRFKIQQRFPKAAAIRTELLYSTYTIVIFGLVIYATIFSPLKAYTQLYTNIHEHPGWYYVCSLTAVILLHDTYFYWMHRFMHWKRVFRFIHAVHHRSHNPTPLAAFAFHPLEALLEIAILPLIVFTLPVHKSVIGLFGLYMIVMNVMGHLGFELFPQRFIHNRFLRLFNTSTHHNMHHHYGRGNYGLYFNVWDRIMRTNHALYEKEFTEVTQRTKPVVDL